MDVTNTAQVPSVLAAYLLWSVPCFRFRQLLTQSGPDVSVQFVGRVVPLSRNVRQSNHVLGNEIAGNKAERWPRAGEEWLAATKHDRGAGRVDIHQ